MKFTGELSDSTKKAVEACDLKLTDPNRLRALAETQLIGSPSELAYDRLAKLAAEILSAPLTIVSLITDKIQFFKASYGMPSPFDVSREIPVDGSICRYTLNGEAIIVADASKDPLLSVHPTTKPWGIVAFIAIPMITKEGQVLGAFCAVDSKVREWSEKDIRILTGLTESVMTEINLRTEVRALQREKELRDHFVAALTHDLRTPISAAKLGAQFLKRGRDGDKNLLSGLERIERSINRADAMIENLLDATLIKSGGYISLRTTDTDLSAIVRNVIDSYNDPRISAKLPASLPGKWDGNAIHRILDNLINNAIKYGDRETPIRVSLDNDKFANVLSVQNQGKPIPLKDQETLFEAFHRTRSAEEGSEKGWGIGLTLVRGLTESMGGNVAIKSNEHEGTTFFIHLPR